MLGFDSLFYPAQPSAPPWGARDGQRPSIYWGVANIWISNHTPEPLVLYSRIVACDRPNDPCGETIENRDIPPRGGGAPFWTRSFLQAGRSSVTLRLIRNESGEEVMVVLDITVAAGMDCDVEIGVHHDRANGTDCRHRGRFSLSDF